MKHGLKTTEIAVSITAEIRKLRLRERKRIIHAQRVSLYLNPNWNPFLYILRLSLCPLY